jgi:hypothetical protein
LEMASARAASLNQATCGPKLLPGQEVKLSMGVCVACKLYRSLSPPKRNGEKFSGVGDVCSSSTACR